MSDELKNIVEAVLLASDTPLNVARIQSLFERNAQPSAQQVKQAFQNLQQECEARGSGIELCRIGAGYRYQTRQKYADWVGKMHAARAPKMSRALLETLAIIAYRQPVTRGDIEDIRGVSVSAEIIQRLRDREWIKQVGVRDLPGHPALLATTPEFLSWFGLQSLKDLPPLQPQRELSEIAEEMEASLPPEVLVSLQNSTQQDVFTPPESADAEHAETESALPTATEMESMDEASEP